MCFRYAASAADYGKKTSAKVSGRGVKVDSRLTDEWREAIRREREREQTKRQQATGVSANSNSNSSTNARKNASFVSPESFFSDPFSHNHVSTEHDINRTRYSDKTDRELQEENKRADAADLQRQQRVSSLAEQMSTMKVSELKHLMEASGLSVDGCCERADLIERLCAFYGIPVTATSMPSGIEEKQRQQNNHQPPQPQQQAPPPQQPRVTPLRVSMDMDVERLRQAMRVGGVQVQSKLGEVLCNEAIPLKASLDTDAGARNSREYTGASANRIDRKTFDSLSEEKVTAPSSSSCSNYTFSGMTKAKLQGLEQKILGNRSRMKNMSKDNRRGSKASDRNSTLDGTLGARYGGLKIASGFSFDESDSVSDAAAEEGKNDEDDDDDDPISARYHAEEEYRGMDGGIEEEILADHQKVHGGVGFGDRRVYRFGRGMISDDESDGDAAGYDEDDLRPMNMDKGSPSSKETKTSPTLPTTTSMWRSEDDDIFEQFNRRFLEKRFLFVNPPPEDDIMNNFS